MAKIKVIGLCGSLRAESWNLKLLRNFLGAMDSSAFDCQVWPSLEMPLLNEDLEKSPLDERILNYRAALESAQIVVIASPEYNGSPSSAIKNAIDWATRPPGNLWVGKLVVILGASPGAFGAIRGAIHLRTVLSGIKAWVIPEQVHLSHSHTAFDATGALLDDNVKKQIAIAVDAIKSFSEKML